MVRGLEDIVHALTIILPPWAVVTLLVVVGAAVLPAWIRSIRSKQIRGRLRTAASVQGAGRQRLVDEAFELAGSRDHHLAVLTEHALTVGLHDVVKRGLGELEARGRLEVAARIRARLEAAEAPRRHPLEIAAHVQTLLEHDLTEMALEQVEIGLRYHPNDADLLALRDRLTEHGGTPSVAGGR